MRWIIRFLLIIVFVLIGLQGATQLGQHIILGAGVGFLFAILVLLVENFLSLKSVRDVISFVFGVSIGMVVANLAAFIVSMIPSLVPAKLYIFIFANLIFAYLFGTFTYYKRYEIKVLDLWIGERKGGSIKVLDTSSIIDGRIRDIAGTEFFEGEIVVPRFIIKELQNLADAQDPMKRARGRRGLEILEEMQDDSNINIKLIEGGIREEKEVDMKIVELAKQMGAKVITNDYNLNKVAALHGVKILNINELALKTRPIFLPGEKLKVKIIKRGKEPGQGVGYLPDGTMVVVEESSLLLGRNVEGVVTSVLQTPAGRIVFTRLKKGDEIQNS